MTPQLATFLMHASFFKCRSLIRWRFIQTIQYFLKVVEAVAAVTVTNVANPDIWHVIAAKAAVVAEAAEVVDKNATIAVALVRYAGEICE